MRVELPSGTDEQTHLVAVVALPPPVHGQSLVNRKIVDLLTDCIVRSRVVDISPGNSKKVISYHWKRIRLVAFGLIVLGSCPRNANSVFYTVFESGLGVIYNFLLIGLARLRGYSIFLHHHTSQHSLFWSARFALLCRVGGAMNHVVLSQQMAEDIERQYTPKGQIIVCGNAGIVPDPMQSGVKRKEGPLTIGFMSNLSSEKGLDVVVDLALSAIEMGIDIEFILAGPIGDDEALSTVKNAQDQLGDRMRYLGPVDAVSKDIFFQLIDLFVFPTRYKYEAQPLVLLEAMSYGVPVIASDRGYIRELLAGGGACVDLESFEETCLTLMKKFVLRDEVYRRRQMEARARFVELRKSAGLELRSLVEDISGRA